MVIIAVMNKTAQKKTVNKTVAMVRIVVTKHSKPWPLVKEQTVGW